MTDSNLRDVISQNVDDEHVNKIEDTKEQEAPKVTVTEELKETPLLPEDDLKGKTPEELAQLRSEWNKKYTQTRQKEKEEIRELQAYKTKAEDLEKKLQSLETKSEQVQSPVLKQEQEQVQSDFNLGKMTIEDYTKHMRRIIQEDARNIAREEFKSLKTEGDEDSNQRNLFADFKRSDERFDDKFTDQDSPEYNPTNAWIYTQVKNHMAEALDKYIADNGTSVGFNAKEESRKAIDQFDSYIDSVVKSKLSTQTTQSVKKAQEVSRSNPKGTTVASTSTQKRDLRSLIESNID